MTTEVTHPGGEAEVGPHTPTFKLNPWKLPEPVATWYQYNVLEGKGQGRKPTCLVLVGMPRTGKSKWARSWGRPAETIACAKTDTIGKMDCADYTHLVLDDIQWDTMSRQRKQAVASCKLYGSGDQPVWKPVIITCNREDSVMVDPEMKTYLMDSGATVVNLGEQKLY